MSWLFITGVATVVDAVFAALIRLAVCWDMSRSLQSRKQYLYHRRRAYECRVFCDANTCAPSFRRASYVERVVELLVHTCLLIRRLRKNAERLLALQMRQWEGM